MERQLAAVHGRGLRVLVFWLVVILTVTIDQATKAAVTVNLEHQSMTLIPGVIDIVYVENTGAAFSIGQGGGLIFILVAVAFLVGAMITVWNKPDLPMGLVVSIGLVAGGGMGNMVDRLMEGYVTDFIATRFIDFPVFNVADMCVTVGVFATVIGYWIWDSRRERDGGKGSSDGDVLDSGV